jgi:hypothetical protein
LQVSNWVSLAIGFFYFSSLTKGEVAGSLAILYFSFFSFIKAEAASTILMQFFFFFFFLPAASQLHCWCITSAPFFFSSFIYSEAAVNEA